jgi:uncharacterized protein YcbK (DUF882 family)
MRSLVVLAMLIGVADAAPKRKTAFKGANAPKSSYRKTPLEKPSGNLWLRAENLGEEVRVQIYKAGGGFDNAALAKLDELFRCPRTGEVRAVRAELYEQLSRVQDHFDGKQLVLVSGFRFAERTSSRHHHASAADFRIKGVHINAIREYATTLDTGNMGLGIYPNSEFIHLDFRAPGEPSFRWTDYSGRGKAKKRPPRRHRARKPTS